MAEPEDIRGLYESYLDKVRQLERERKPGEGIFGLKGGPSQDPCHDRFAAELEALLEAFAASEPSPEAAREVLDYMLFLPPEHREERTAYWMLLAVHGLALPLAERLSPAEAGELRRRYGEVYPRWERLPSQKKLLAALKARERDQ